MEDAKKKLKNPFSQERELAAKETRLALLTAQLNIDSGTERVMEVAEPDLHQATYAKSGKPSILENLRFGITGGKTRDNPDKT